MHITKKYSSFLFIIAPFFTSGQVIDNTASFRNINGYSYIRYHYDNDFFTATDYYYTQGMNLEVVHPSLKKFPLVKILLHPKQNELKYGVAVEHIGYTPTSIRHNEILYGDRPFAACLFLKTFLIATDSLKHQRLSSAFSAGVIGPAAGGEGMQKSIHRWLHNIEPLGWKNQIQNDIILNYQISYEKNIFTYRHLFALNSTGEIFFGTLNDKLGAGFNIMIGSFDNPFKSSIIGSPNKNFRYHFYNQPLLNLVGYDASLQGGLFNHNSPYAISSSHVTRIIFQNNFGIIITIRKIYLEYYQSLITKEFKEGKFHRWGGIKIGVGI